MDKKALYNLSYGVFMLATRSGNVVNGCITNTCIQVANNPVRIAISVLNSNYTCDLIADMLTRIRNANTAKHDTVDVPASKMKIAIADILVDEGYIAKYDIVEDGNFKTIRITLKYGADKNEKIITGLKRISKPGLRVYAGKDELPRVLGGLGIAILSTNQGIVTDKEARKLQVGGEVLAFVW